MGGTYVLYWPMYSDEWYARFLCAAVPYAATLAFALVGIGLVPFGALVRSATRSGNHQELLTGPMLYGIVHVVLTIVFWTKSPAGVVAVSALCFGDGAAELVGRRAKARLWHNKNKTWAGSAACLVASAVFTTAYAFLYRALGTFDRDVSAGALVTACLLSSLAATVVESLPLEPDNVTVPLAAAATCVWYLGF